MCEYELSLFFLVKVKQVFFFFWSKVKQVHKLPLGRDERPVNFYRKMKSRVQPMRTRPTIEFEGSL